MKDNIISTDPINPASQTVQASCYQNIIADIPCNVSYEPLSLLYFINEIVKIVRFCDVITTDTRSNLDDTKISLKSLRKLITIYNKIELL